LSKQNCLIKSYVFKHSILINLSNGKKVTLFKQMKQTEVKSNLLKDKYPELLKEWDYEKNKNVDVNTITYGSTLKVYWLCLSNHGSYLASICSKTASIKNFGHPTRCRKCFNDTQRKRDLNAVEEKMKNHIPNIDKIIIGENTEIYITELLTSMNCYKTVTNIGNIGADSDVGVTDEYDNTYYIQVKTLTYIKNDTYRLERNVGYRNNMLIVGVNKDRTRFAIDFVENLKENNVYLAFACKKSKYANIMYTDIDKFKQKIQELMVLSCTEFKFTSITIENEYCMLKRFEKFCIDNNISYARNFTNGNTVDGHINGYTFQAKFVSLNANDDAKTYNVTFYKHAGRLNRANLRQPYEEGDFDYMIIEVGGINDDKNKYKSNFCIIPSKILKQQHLFKTDKDKGKIVFTVCPPDYERQHWTKQYWNKIPQELYHTKITKSI